MAKKKALTFQDGLLGKYELFSERKNTLAFNILGEPSISVHYYVVCIWLGELSMWGEG